MITKETVIQMLNDTHRWDSPVADAKMRQDELVAYGMDGEELGSVDIGSLRKR